MRLIEAGVKPGAGTQHEVIVPRIESPDSGQDRIEMPHHGVGAALENAPEAGRLCQRLPHIGDEGSQAGLLGALDLFVPPLGDQSAADLQADDPGVQQEQYRHRDRDHDRPASPALRIESRFGACAQSLRDLRGGLRPELLLMFVIGADEESGGGKIPCQPLRKSLPA